MATQAVNIILSKEKEAELKIVDATEKAYASFEEAKSTAEVMCNEIISEAKKNADSIIENAQAEVDKMYEDTKNKADARCKSIYALADDLKEKATDTVSYILF